MLIMFFFSLLMSFLPQNLVQAALYSSMVSYIYSNDIGHAPFFAPPLSTQGPRELQIRHREYYKIFSSRGPPYKAIGNMDDTKKIVPVQALTCSMTLYTP